MAASLDGRFILTGNFNGMIKVTNIAPLFEGSKNTPSNPLTDFKAGEKGYKGKDERKNTLYPSNK